MRRQKILNILTLLGLLLTACHPAPPPAVTLPEKPNILFILLDDLDELLDSMKYMPNVQKLLAKQGLSFEGFFITDPECCPSRATILRSQYIHSHQIFTNQPPSGSFHKFLELEREESTVATWLQAAGYRTVLLGKYLNEYPGVNNPTHVPPGWSEWYGLYHNKMHQYFDYQLIENGELVAYGEAPEDYLTDVLSDKADDFLQRAASDPAPFFMYLSLYAPHSPAISAPRHADLFQDVQAPRTASFNEEDIYDKPKSVRKIKLKGEALAETDRLYQRRLQSLQAVDEMVARLVQTLEETGQIERTYIIFTSDNGFHMGQHRFQPGKNRPYEEDIRVPFIIRGPGIQAGEKIKGYLAGTIDLGPTFAELAGAETPGFIEGRSLVPLFFPNRPAPESWRQVFLIESYPDVVDKSAALLQFQPPGRDERMSVFAALHPAAFKVEGDAPDWVAIRTARYKFVIYATGEKELYDLQKDPAEMENLFKTADPALLAQLEDWMRALYDCSGETCQQADQPAGVP